MLIIIEGPNGVGKTTLSNMIAAKTLSGNTIEQLHAGPPKGHPLDEYVKRLTTYRPGRSTHIICDRWHWGEMVYPEIFARQTQYNPLMNHYVEMFLRSRGAVVVRLDADHTKIVRSIMRRGDDMLDVANLDAIVATEQSGFKVTMRRSILPVIEHYGDVTQGLAAKVINAARIAEMNTVKLNPLITYVGQPRPTYLLFGDVRNKIDHFADPAFMPYAATSGAYLLRSAPYVQILRQCGFANACDVDDPRKVLAATCPDFVVALGNNAAKKLDALDIPHGSVPHPQYWRRFHHADFHVYGDLILRALINQKDLRREVLHV